MTDTVRTDAINLGLLADNEDGEIDAQVVRDSYVSLETPSWIRYLNHRLSGETAHASDDFFDDASFTGWTTVTVTGTQTITELHDKLSVLVSGQSANDINTILKAVPASAPLTIETAVSMIGSVQNHNIFGLCYTDGTTTTANAVGFDMNLNSSRGIAVRTGTLTNLNGSADSSTLTLATGNRLYMRFAWKSSDTFRANISVDGVIWYDLGMGDSAATITPTHMGIYWSTWGGSLAQLLSFDYLRVYETDLSV